MKPIRWNAEKNAWLKRERDISFERILIALEGQGPVDVLAHPDVVRYPNQHIFVVVCDGGAYLVAFFEEDDYFFLKTITPYPKGSAAAEAKGNSMAQFDAYEREIAMAYAQGKLKSVVSKEELVRYRAAARATSAEDRRVSIRLPSDDLSDIQAKAQEQGMPFRTLIADILHKYVAGHLTEC